MTALAATEAAVLCARQCGVAALRVIRPPSGTPTERLDAALALVGLTPIGITAISLDRIGAQRIVRAVLHRDLAYGSECMPPGLADDLAQRILDHAEDPRALFPNASWCGERLSEFNPVTKATFDTLVSAVGPTSVLLFWVADED